MIGLEMKDCPLFRLMSTSIELLREIIFSLEQDKQRLKGLFYLVVLRLGSKEKVNEKMLGCFVRRCTLGNKTVLCLHDTAL